MTVGGRVVWSSWGEGVNDPSCRTALAKIKSGDVVLPTHWGDGPERTIRQRCVTTPQEAQKVLLNCSGLALPERPRRIDGLAHM